MALISAIYGNNTFSQKKQNRKKRKFEARLASKKAEYYARELSGGATDAEIKLQHILVDLRIQYVFQKVFMVSNKDFRIVDFWLPQLQTVIEVDGGYHDDPVQQWKDAQRSKVLIRKNKKQIKHILRFTNEEVLNHPDLVSDKIGY